MHVIGLYAHGSNITLLCQYRQQHGCEANVLLVLRTQQFRVSPKSTCTPPSPAAHPFVRACRPQPGFHMKISFEQKYNNRIIWIAVHKTRTTQDRQNQPCRSAHWAKQDTSLLGSRQILSSTTQIKDPLGIRIRLQAATKRDLARQIET